MSNDLNNEQQPIPENELDPENNPMRVSGSKYLSDTARKAVLGIGILGLGILFTTLMGDDFFSDPNDNKKEEKVIKNVIADNSLNAEVINGMAGPESIIPANLDTGIVGENNESDIPNDSNTIAMTETPSGTRIQLIDPNSRNHGSVNLPPPQNTMQQPSYEDEAARQKRMDKERERQQIRQTKIQMFNNSVNSPSKMAVAYEKTKTSTSYSSVPPSSSNTSESLSYAKQERERILSQMADLNDPNGSYQQKINAMRNGSTYQPSENNATRFSITTASSTETGDKWTLDSSVQAPKRLSIITGSVLPATLITGINSDLPGKIIAQVSQNVYDSPTGRFMLVPQGTKIFGTYESGVVYGQERVLVSWNRLIFPDGKTIDIGSMNGTDQAGYSGMNDLVNNHYLRLFTSSFLLSVISAGITYSQDKYTSNNENGTTASSAMAQSFGSQMGNTALQMIQKNMNISPTLEIRPGFKINVMVTKDIIFSKPYQNYDY
ncbi:TrbI/VirB10 family protein [Ruminobacter sp. RM87]|uniref:TrbI/VirB10 family protein n=1 Tax=Ruminobacter sp. RM87 TaxID=1200567 RepID=UPI00068BF5B3|nr:TrbI/VirB10 family protein [Ruminobacter sp. RM87]